jgi:hypothetical protein
MYDFLLKPPRNFDTYKRLIALCIASREQNIDLSQTFVLTLPSYDLYDLSTHFRGYGYTVLGGSAERKDFVLVYWSPKSRA